MRKKDTFEDNLAKKNLVSIIIPVYNAASYIETAIKSLLNQTYKNIEIIFINDGSTDNSLDIINFYQKSLSNIKVVNQENCGPGEARNKGIELASGMYLMFLDADDFFEQSCCMDAVNLIKNSHSDFVCFGANFINYKGRIHSSFSYGDENLSGHAILKSFLKGKKIKSVVWNKIYLKSFIYKFSIRFNSNKVNEDSLFVLKATVHANNIKISPKILYAHRSVNSRSYANFITYDHFKSTLEVIDAEKKYLEHFNLLNASKNDFDIHMAKVFTHMLYLGAVSKNNISYYINCANIILKSDYWNFLIKNSFSLFPINIKVRIFLSSRSRILWFFGRFLRAL